MKNSSYYNKEILELFKNLLRYNKTNLSFLSLLLRTLWYQKKALNRRTKSKYEGVQVPPLLVISITKSCNLNCTGCYQKAQNRTAKTEMSEEKIVSILSEANELGSSVVLLVGGEPFTRKDIFNITKRFKNMIFGVFTNGVLIDQSTIINFKNNKNVIPILSLEGDENMTDERRGTGVYHHAKSVAFQLKANKIPFGVSLTATNRNYQIITTESYINNHIESGCKFFFYFDYIPNNCNNKELWLNSSQQSELKTFYKSFRKKYKSLCLAASAEENIGGCLGAGRGLIHINYDGSVEPCPFSPISNRNLYTSTLKDSLKSDLFQFIRDNHDKLENNNSGSCTLWENRDLVSSFLEQNK